MFWSGRQGQAEKTPAGLVLSAAVLFVTASLALCFSVCLSRLCITCMCALLLERF